MPMLRNNHGRIQGRAGQKLRERRLKRSNYLCEDCLAEGKTTLATIVDHTHPLSLGGLDVDDNTRNLCDLHNEKRTAEQFGFKVKQAIGDDGWPI